MRMKQNARRGFTLVEVIVVLVILAILAAIMIPAMTGWIDRAREKRLIVACRSCVNAAQTLASEAYGINETKAAPAAGDVLKLAGVNGEVSGISMADNAAVDSLTYSDDSGESVTYFRLPNPHYEFGTGGGLTGTALAADTLNAMTTAFNNLPSKGASNINGIYKDDPVAGQRANAIYNSLTSEQKKFLDGVSWSFNNTNNGWRLYFTKENYGAESKTDITVYKYDMTTLMYQETNKGTKIQDGKITANGRDWDEWKPIAGSGLFGD